MEKAQKPWVIVPRIPLPMVHAGDVAAAIKTALHTGESIGQAYNLGGCPQDLSKVIGLIAELTGSGCRVYSFPFLSGVSFDDSAAMRDLGLVHRSLEEGIREMLEGSKPM